MKEKVASRKTIEKIFATAKYAGKHIIMIAGKVFTARTGKEASLLFNKLTEKYKGHLPVLTYVPKEDTLILFL
jgi:hypothetical protein